LITVNTSEEEPEEITSIEVGSSDYADVSSEEIVNVTEDSLAVVLQMRFYFNKAGTVSRFSHYIAKVVYDFHGFLILNQV
jgi:hypothetical protein